MKGNFFFLASSTIYMTEHHVALHAKKNASRDILKLADIKSENIEVYISFNNSIQENGQTLSE